MTARRAAAICAIWALTAATPAAAKLRVARSTAVPTPAGVCGGVADPSTPTIAAGPAGRRISVSLLLRGGDAASFAASRNGGRSFAASVIAGASACTGGPASHAYLANPRGGLAPDGRAWYGSSWIGSDAGVFAYGVEALSSDGHALRPPGSAQDVAMLPGRSGVQLLWTAYDQVPNPATYAPTGTRVMSARGEGDTLGPPAVALQVAPGSLHDDPSLVRAAGGALVAVASEGRLDQLVQTLNPATATEPVRFSGVSARSTDGGRSWSPAGRAGAPVQFTFERDGQKAVFGLSDVAARGERVVRVWAEPPTAGRGRIMAAESIDGARTWSAPTALVDVPVLAVLPSVAVLPDGRLALSWYDARDDREGDGRLELRPWAAVIGRDRARRNEVALGASFDFGPLTDPPYPVDTTALGDTQDLAPLRTGCATVHTEPAPEPATTRVVFTRVSTRR